MSSTKRLADLWAAEYESKGLPSSFRQEPSGAVRDFVELALRLGIKPPRCVAIDLGCGTGRNSLYLAERGFTVHALDIVADLIAKLGRRAEEAGLQSRLHAVCGSVCDAWPLSDASAAVSIDTFCYKHLMAPEGRMRYRDELARVVQPNGLYLLTLASIDDGYYGSLPYRRVAAGMHAITDPVNGIDSMLYTRQAVETCFAGAFSLIQYAAKTKPGLMHGAEYTRATHVFVMKRT